MGKLDDMALGFNQQAEKAYSEFDEFDIALTPNIPNELFKEGYLLGYAQALEDINEDDYEKMNDRIHS